MGLSLLCGALVGVGVYAFVRVLLRPEPGVATMLARIEHGQRSMRTHTLTEMDSSFAGMSSGTRSVMARLADRLEVLVAERGWQLGRVRADLALMGRSVGAFLAVKVVTGLVFFFLAPVAWAALSIIGISLSSAVPVVLALTLGVFGFFIPDLALKSEAGVRRREFRRTVGVFLDLVAMNLAGGRGLPEALLAAATISEHWSLLRIRQSLANARLVGTTPWVALGELGEEIDLEELRDLGAALGLAAEDGAKIRLSLAARAATLRRKELTDAEGDEGERSQSMLVAQLLICTAFLIYLAYPAITRLLAT
ncbi:type II secretion system protein [Luteipulveratus mongoliensis]|uniref:Type II secretion system protein n=2 Tax=Luteipulveratus mongoliensis TaxID=571913 RepID=A0A0K1JR81_9MICO|nr:type II secretion system protein [Luteipulveratus mongoliensis]